MSRAEVTTNYASRPEGGDAAPSIDLAARLALALGVPVADLLPTAPDLDDRAVTRRQARKLFDELAGSEDRADSHVISIFSFRPFAESKCAKLFDLSL
jgi:transcriptional regulator with XRE-family HTH domain